MARAMPLHEFCSYVGQQRRAIQEVYAEIEEIQFRFNDIHRQTMEAWQATMGKTVPMLADGGDLPPSVAQSLLQATDKERARLESEIADLTAQASQQRQAADAAALEAQAEVAALRNLNPRLDAEEEEIKARRASIEQRIRELEAAMRATPFLVGLFQRRRLRKERDGQRRALAQAAAELRRVREAWEDEKVGFQANQSRLHEKWESASVEAAQLQGRLDYLQANLERLSRRNGAANWLAGLESLPEAGEPLRQALAEMVELNRTKREYEEGLRMVAEALGLLKGLGDGMERFLMSADKVLEEQRQYDLKELRVSLGDDVLGFHALWPEFRAQVRDEKTLGTHPLEFSRRARAIIDSRLGDQAIAAMFESMGSALTEATRAWG